MTISQNRQNLSRLEAANVVDIYNSSGRIDPVASHEANKDIFSEANLVKAADGSIDHTATVAKHAAAKVATLNKRN